MSELVQHMCVVETCAIMYVVYFVYVYGIHVCGIDVFIDGNFVYQWVRARKPT